MKLNIQELSEGEIYVGCIGDAAGTLHHVILLPGDNDDGYQGFISKDYEFRARAVRRLGEQ